MKAAAVIFLFLALATVVVESIEREEKTLEVGMEDFVVRPKFNLFDEYEPHREFKECYGRPLNYSLHDSIMKNHRKAPKVDLEKIVEFKCEAVESDYGKYDSCARSSKITQGEDFDAYTGFFRATVTDICADPKRYVKSLACLGEKALELEIYGQQHVRDRAEFCNVFEDLKKTVLGYVKECDAPSEAVEHALKYFFCDGCDKNERKRCLF